jgi:hypothetical protein
VEFHKRSQLYIGTHNVAFPMAAMCVSNPGFRPPQSTTETEPKLQPAWSERENPLPDGTLYDSRCSVIECPAPSTTIFLAMKNSIIFISALSLVAMMLASCASVFAPDETATTDVTSQTNETPLSEAQIQAQSVVDIIDRIL